ncbi:hypothetical protein ACWG5P_26460 [Streptomyces prasinus]
MSCIQPLYPAKEGGAGIGFALNAMAAWTRWDAAARPVEAAQACPRLSSRQPGPALEPGRQYVQT